MIIPTMKELFDALDRHEEPEVRLFLSTGADVVGRFAGLITDGAESCWLVKVVGKGMKMEFDEMAAMRAMSSLDDDEDDSEMPEPTMTPQTHTTFVLLSHVVGVTVIRSWVDADTPAPA